MDIINISSYEEIEDNFERFLDGDAKGKISLPVPVLNILKWKPVAERISLATGLSVEDIDRVLYYAAYVVLDPMETKLAKNTVLSEKEYREAVEEYGPDSFRKGMGAEALVEVFSGIDTDAVLQEGRKEEISLMQHLESLSKKFGTDDGDEFRELTPEEEALAKEEESVLARLAVVRAKMSGAYYLWENKDKMLIREVNLFPAGIRAAVKSAVSPKNQFYLGIVNRAYDICFTAESIRRLSEMKAPDILIQERKYRLQKQVDAYITGNFQEAPLASRGRKPAPGLADLILMDMPIV
jgi:DNA-directed RNA polymerase subunit beta'